MIVVGSTTPEVMPVSLSKMLQAPSAEHWLGTDNLGRDLTQRLGSAITDAVLPMWLTITLASLIGHGIGILQVLVFASRILAPLARLIQIASSIIATIPAGIAAFALSAWMGGAGLLPVALALAPLFGIRCYLSTLELYERDRQLGYWQAHVAIGGSNRQRIVSYGLKGTWLRPMFENLGFHLRAAVAIEAAISYLGFGIQEPSASLGNMLASHFDQFLHGSWMTLTFIVAALFMCSTIPLAIFRTCQSIPHFSPVPPAPSTKPASTIH